jgi:hypothetical protein
MKSIINSWFKKKLNEAIGDPPMNPSGGPGGPGMGDLGGGPGGVRCDHAARRSQRR